MPIAHQPNRKRLARALTLLCLACASLLAPATAYSHALNWTYTFLTIEESGLTGRLELPVDQLDAMLGLDTNDDGNIAEDEVASRWDDIEQYASEIVRFGPEDNPYPLTFTSRGHFDIEITVYAVLEFELDTPLPVPPMLQMQFEPFFTVTSDHRGALVLENNYLTGIYHNEATMALLFAEGRTTGEIDLRGETLVQELARFVIEGIWHIWIGLDHVLFLVTLLLAAVMTQRDGRWLATENFRTAFLNLVGVITVFTIAHTATLALAMKGWVTLPSRLVESIIALSVLIVALNNVRPFLTTRVWLLVFGFGLFHGLGFASVLVQLVVSRESKVISLVGFNVGVEIGQLMIVAVLFPILFWSRTHDWYRKGVFPGLSILIGLIALWWFVTRALGIDG